MLYLPPGLIRDIREYGEAAYPNECCGIILGTSGDGECKEAQRLIPVLNAREDTEQYHRFLITAEDMLEAELEAHRQKLDVIGFYHSHPDHPAAPSDYDRDHALPFYSYVIVAVEKKKARQLAGWLLKDDRSGFFPEEIADGPNQ